MRGQTMMHMLDMGEKKEESGASSNSLDSDWVQLPAESLEGTRKSKKGAS